MAQLKQLFRGWKEIYELRHNLGCLENEAGNHHRSVKHFILATRAGDKDSLDNVKDWYMNGIITKDEYENSLRSYQRAHDETKSDMRDKARATMNDGFTKS